MAQKTTKKEKVFTEEMYLSIEKIASRILEVRSSLEYLRGEKDLSTIMYEVGAAATLVNWCEEEMDTIIDAYRGENEEDL